MSGNQLGMLAVLRRGPRGALGAEDPSLSKKCRLRRRATFFDRRWSALYENDFFFYARMIMISDNKFLIFYLFRRLCRSSPRNQSAGPFPVACAGCPPPPSYGIPGSVPAGSLYNNQVVYVWNPNWSLDNIKEPERWPHRIRYQTWWNQIPDLRVLTCTYVYRSGLHGAVNCSHSWLDNFVYFKVEPNGISLPVLPSHSPEASCHTG